MTETGVVEMGIQARAQLEAGRWVQAATLFDRMEKAKRLSPNENVYYGVALTNLNKVDKALNRFTDSALSSSNRRNFVRRRAVVPQLQNENYSNAEAVLQRLLEIAPDNVANLGSLATIFLREQRDSDALDCLKRAYALNPGSAALRNRLLQTHVRLNDQKGACRFALKERHRWHDDPRFAHTSAAVLLKAQRPHDAVGAADAIFSQQEIDAPAVATAAQIYLDAKQPQRALAICRMARRKAVDSADIRYMMAQACHQRDCDPSIVIHHLKAGQSLDRDHAPIARMLGRMLMLSGDFRSATIALQNAVRIEPKRIANRIDLAHVLHLRRQFGEAANVYEAAIKATSNCERWTPRAVSTLIAAGRREEAETLFDAYRAQRGKGLPKTLASGLAALNGPSAIDGAVKENLGWALTIARNVPGGHPARDRTAWQRSAVWGYCADALITDWMECRPRKHRELLDLIDVDEKTRDLLQRALSHGRGALIATANIGMALPVPFAFRKLGVPHKWLAPIPQTSPVAADDTLISTSELSSADVSFKFFHALAKGSAVIIAVDDAQDPSAPTVSFEGRKIHYSDFAARAAHRNRVPSFFAMAVWRGRRIDLVLKPLPKPEAEESVEAFKSRWTTAFFAHLKNGFGLPPENLRLRGGLWRPVR